MKIEKSEYLRVLGVAQKALKASHLNPSCSDLAVETALAEVDSLLAKLDYGGLDIPR